ncbi:MAG: phosphoribosylaminoimidazolesuccinocarboxamide synthase [Candidatus Binatia bacterium]
MLVTGTSTVTATNFDDLRLVYRGKVRDVYEPAENQLLLVATDRLSAFDCILPTPIRLKGHVLTALSVFWFRKLEAAKNNHLITTEFDEMPGVVRRHAELRGRCVLVKKTKVFPVECIVRGYLEGSGWKDYLATGEICGHKLPEGLKQCQRLPEPLFTPATKAETGHDENISEEKFALLIGEQAAKKLKEMSLAIYNEAAKYALTRGIVIADTKFEFGLDENREVTLIDEILTPDSSRFWDAAAYEPGHAQPSFDKQFVREYLESLDWDKKPPAPALPLDIAEATTARYLRAYNLITGDDLG